MRNTPGRRERDPVVGYSLLDGLAKSNSALADHDAEAVCRTQERRLSANGIHRAAARQFQASGSDRVRLQSAADHRPRHRHRLRISALRAAAAPIPGRLPRSRAAWCSPSNQDPALKPRVHHLQRQHAAALSRSRPREGADARHRRFDVFNALQSVLGGSYVNDFNLFGRTWQVNVQGEASERARGRRHLSDQCAQQERRHGAGSRLRQCRLILGPQSIIRYNNYRSVTINGGPAAGHQSGDALAAMEQISAATLPAATAIEWTGTALQEKEAAGKTTIILALAVLFAYLFLVASTRAGRSRSRCCCRFRSACSGAMAALLLFGPRQQPLCADRPRGADRAGRQERHSDRRIRQGAARARPVDPGGGHRGRPRAVPRGDDDELRLHRRALPLVIATGAGMLSRRGVGTAVFGGMLAASPSGFS